MRFWRFWHFLRFGWFLFVFQVNFFLGYQTNRNRSPKMFCWSCEFQKHIEIFERLLKVSQSWNNGRPKPVYNDRFQMIDFRTWGKLRQKLESSMIVELSEWSMWDFIEHCTRALSSTTSLMSTERWEELYRIL